MAARVDADIAARSGDYRYALITIGANNFGGALPPQATFEADLAYTLDAIHTAWPATRLGVALPWSRTYDAQADTLATWIANVLSTRSWAFAGPDERVYLKGADDGATYTVDGVHPNAAGYALAAARWQTSMGY